MHELAHRSPLIAGANPSRPLDVLFVNAPLRDYTLRPRVNDFTLPVLGMAYIATYAAQAGYNAGVMDAEAYGLGISATTGIINDASPRWAGFNLLAPTYEISAQIAAALDPAIEIMLGGHQAKAMPAQILADSRMRRRAVLVIGEAETRVSELLGDHQRRAVLPGVMWPGLAVGQVCTGHARPARITWPLTSTPSRSSAAPIWFRNRTGITGGWKPAWSGPAAACTTARFAVRPSAPTPTSPSGSVTRRTS